MIKSHKYVKNETLANLLSCDFENELSEVIKCDKGFCVFDDKIIKKYKNLVYVKCYTERAVDKHPKIW